jgi:dTDP-4-dehydrorhamnose reductase
MMRDKRRSGLRLLLTGAGGQIGWELERALAPFGILYASHAGTLDLRDERAIRGTVRDFMPDAIINAAAYTAVDRAEGERDLCHRLNAKAPGILAEEAERLGAWMIHYSSDYVYSGRNSRPWLEDDEPDPVNYYGESKLAGDTVVSGRASRHIIFRTSWVYASRGSNFLLTMLRLFGADKTGDKKVRVVDDQIGAPTWARFLAEATAHALRQALDSADSRLSGIYHLACGGSTSWHGFAGEILDYAGKYLEIGEVGLEAIRTEDYPSAAARPAWSLLSTEKASETFGIYAMPWRDAARLCLEEVRERAGKKDE